LLFYRAALPLSPRTLTYLAGVIRRHRTSIGSTWRRLNPGQQALLVLVHLRKGEIFAEVAADRPYYSGKHHHHGMNVQIIAAPDGTPLWTSGSLPGSVHDLKAARIWGIIRRLESAGLITLADKAYIGADQRVLVPYKGRKKPASQKAANSAHAKLRGPGERANAVLKTWRILRKLRCCPLRAGQLVKAIFVLQARESG